MFFQTFDAEQLRPDRRAIVPRRMGTCIPQEAAQRQDQCTSAGSAQPARRSICLGRHRLTTPSTGCEIIADPPPSVLRNKTSSRDELKPPIIFGGSLGSAPSTITSAHSPWHRMASAKQLASRTAKSLDQNGVVVPSPIRMAQPCCSLTTLKVIMDNTPATNARRLRVGPQGPAHTISINIARNHRLDIGQRPTAECARQRQ